MTVEPIGEPGEHVLDGVPARVVKLHLKLGETKQRFLLLSVAQKNAQTLVVQCECDVRRRGDWEPRFMQLLSSWKWRPE